MKESTWEECIENNSAVERRPDMQKAKSLFQTAKARQEFLEKNNIDEINANFIFEGYYSSIAEIVHSIIIKQGYNVNNHICIGFFLRDVIKNKMLYQKFDDCRYKRNSLLYYGKQMDFEVAKKTIKDSKEIIKELEEYYLKFQTNFR